MSKRELIDISSNYSSPPTCVGWTSSIPNRFVQTWKTTTLDSAHALKLVSFRKCNTDFEFEISDDQKASKFMNEQWGSHPINNIYKNLRFGASKADIWRYCNLYKFGGIYLDIDSSISVPLNKIIGTSNENISFEDNMLIDFLDREHSADYTFFQRRNFEQNKLQYPNRPVLNWCMVFAPKHPALKSTIDSIVRNAPFYSEKKFTSAHKAIVNFTGPIALTKAIWLYADQAAQISQCGLDYEGMAKFKDIPNEKESVYNSSLQSSYHNQKKQRIMNNNDPTIVTSPKT